MISGPFFILIDDLQTVVVDILLVNQIDVLSSAIFASQVLYIVFLNLTSLFHDAFVGIGNLGFEEGFPFFIREAVLVKTFKLFAKVKYKIFFVVNGYVLIALFAKHFDEGCFQSGFVLICIGAFGLRLIFGYNGAFIG